MTPRVGMIGSGYSGKNLVRVLHRQGALVYVSPLRPQGRMCGCGVGLPLRGSGQPVIAQCEACGRRYVFNEAAFRRADARLGDTSS